MDSYFLVADSLDRAPIREHLLHGYETKSDFREALQHLVNRWKGRVGECVDERHGFLLLRFHDTPGGRPDEEWLPKYLLQPTERPAYLSHEEYIPDEMERELDEAFGFD